MSSDLHYLTIAGSCFPHPARASSRPPSSDGYASAAVGTLDPQLNAFITVTAERARDDAKRERARSRLRTLPRAAVHGVAARRLQGTVFPNTERDTLHERRLRVIAIDNVSDEDAATTRRLHRRRRDPHRASCRRTSSLTGGPSFNLPVAAGSQSLESRSLHGQLIERVRSRACWRAHSSMARFRHGRVRSAARRRLYSAITGIHADVWAREWIRRHAEFVHVQPLWADGAHGEGGGLILQAIAGADPRDGGSMVPNRRAQLSRRDARRRHQGLCASALRVHYCSKGCPGPR